MQTIVIRHLTGARANQVEQFPTGVVKEIIVGREMSAQVRFDPDRDDLVSRQHMRIIRDPSDPAGFQLVDLQSRNGSFVNHQRVYGTVRLNHSDVIQLGAGGPEFRFEVDPPPMGATRPTREATMESFGMKATREAWSPPAGAGAAPIGGLSNGPRPVGRATVERMLGDVFGRVQKENRKSTWAGIAAIVAIVLVGGGIALYVRQSNAQQKVSEERSMASLQRVNDELRRNPAAANSMKEQIARLESELKQSDQRQQVQAQSLLKEVKMRAQEAMMTTPLPAGASGKTAGKAAQATDGATALPTGASSASGSVSVATVAKPLPPVDTPDLSNATYDSLMDQAAGRFQGGKTIAALDLVRFAIKKEPGKWEGYEFAGQLEEIMKNYSDAVTWYEQALQKAPSDSRQDIQYKLDTLKHKIDNK